MPQLHDETFAALSFTHEAMAQRGVVGDLPADAVLSLVERLFATAEEHDIDHDTDAPADYIARMARQAAGLGVQS